MMFLFKRWMTRFKCLLRLGQPPDRALLKQTRRTFWKAALLSKNWRRSVGIDHHKAMVAAHVVKPGDLVIDVGACHGSYSLFYDRLVSHEGKVFAYEANPYLFDFLKKRVARIKGPNISFFENAVSEFSGHTLSMRLYPENTEAQCSTVEPHLMDQKHMPGKTTSVEVLTVALDDLLEHDDLPKTRLIKIDAEGHEHAILKGAKKLLKAHRPYVIFEYTYQAEDEEPTTIKQMEEAEYVCYDLANDHMVRPGFMTSITDLLAIPKEKQDQLSAILPHLQ